MKGRCDWFISVPWGKLALVGHGHPDGYPVFLVHGRQDSSSVFEPLIEQMTEQYYFVALDMPGNGLSDAFPPVLKPALQRGDPHYAVMYNKPPLFENSFLDFERYSQGLTYTETTSKGPKLMRFHFLAAMEFAIQHLGWDKFIFVGHSMGCEQGLFYNVVNPGQITKMILLDAGPTLMRMQVQDQLEYQRYYDEYYKDYDRANFERKPYLRTIAIQALQRHRELTGDQCEIIIARNYHGFPFYHENISKEKRNDDKLNKNEQNAEEAPITNGKETTIETEIVERIRDDDEIGYLSWDNRLKNLAPQNYGNDYYFALFKTIPPTLLIAASDGAKNVPPNPKWRQGAKELLDRMATLDNFHRVDVEGSHDVHFTHPERVLPYVNAFLQDIRFSSKL